MATGILKSFNRDHALAIVKLDGRSGEVALRVTGGDRITIAGLTPGRKIQFDLACSRHGQVYAVDVAAEPVPPRALSPAHSTRRFHRPAPAKSEGQRSAIFKLGDPDDDCGLYGPVQRDLEKALLATPVLHRLMDQGRADPLAVQRLVRSVARAAMKEQ